MAVRRRTRETDGKHTRMVRDGRGGAQESTAPPAETGLRGAGGRHGEGRHAAGQHAGLQRASVRAAAIADLPAAREMATSVLGQEISLPVIASPTGVQAVHPDGEVGVARGTAKAGTAMGLSSFGSMPVEAVAEVNPKLFFQTYWSGSKDQDHGADRTGPPGRRQGPDRHPGLVVLQRAGLGQSGHTGEDRPPHSPAPGPGGHPQARLRSRVALARRLPDLTVPNMAAPGAPAPTFFGVYGEWMQTPPPTWRTWPGCASNGAAPS